jgi:hypothetical protein
MCTYVHMIHTCIPVYPPCAILYRYRHLDHPLVLRDGLHGCRQRGITGRCRTGAEARQLLEREASHRFGKGDDERVYTQTQTHTYQNVCVYAQVYRVVLIALRILLPSAGCHSPSLFHLFLLFPFVVSSWIV